MKSSSIGWGAVVLLLCVGCKDRKEVPPPAVPKVVITNPEATPDTGTEPDLELEPEPEKTALDELQQIRHKLRDQHAQTLVFIGQVEKPVEAGYRIQWCEGERCAPSTLTLVSSEGFESGQKIGIRIRYLDGDNVEVVPSGQDDRLHGAIQAARLESETLLLAAPKQAEWSQVVELTCAIRKIPTESCKVELAIARRTYLKRGDAYEALGNYAAADEAYQRALLEEPSHLGLEQLVRFYITAPDGFRDGYLAEGYLRRLEIAGSNVVAASARIERFLQVGDVESAKAVLSVNSQKELDAYRARFGRGEVSPLSRPQELREVPTPASGPLTMDERLVVLEEFIDDEHFSHPEVPKLYEMFIELASDPDVKSRFEERGVREVESPPTSEMLPRLP